MFCLFFQFYNENHLKLPLADRVQWIWMEEGGRLLVDWSALLTHSEEVLGLNPLWSFPLSMQVISGYFSFGATFKGIRGV